LNKKPTLIITLIGIGAILYLWHCPFRFLLGISCPGCGMKSALLALLRLDFSAAFYYHPLWPLVVLVVVYYGLVLLKIYKLTPGKQRAYFVAIMILFIGFYLYRLLVAEAVILRWHTADGWLFKLFK